VILTGGFSLETAKKRVRPSPWWGKTTKARPDVGNLVVPRIDRLWPTPAIIIDKRGIEVLVMLPDSRRVWVRRDALLVLP
jgi:hypothetical protein